jgi:signal transduction histidine kinase
MNRNETSPARYREPEAAQALTAPLARSLREARASVTYRWLERIEERVEVGEDEVFPSPEMLDHVPLLIDAVADFIEDPAEEGTAADQVMAKAAELGTLRYDQGFSTYQILKEFEILGGVILSFLRGRVSHLGFTPDPEDVVIVAHRVYRALAKVQQATAARHIGLLERQRRDLGQRLRLGRDVLREVVDGTLPAALEAGPDSREARDLLASLNELRRLAAGGSAPRRKGVPLEGAINEAIRRVRPIAQKADLEVRVSAELPDAEVPDAEVEQCLVVYLTNALRHCAEADGECWVQVEAESRGEEGEVVVSVRNTGPSVPDTDDITRLAPEPHGPDESGVEEGQRGVGLRFARDLARTFGGRTWAGPARDPDGAVFCLALPRRRRADQVADPAGS